MTEDKTTDLPFPGTRAERAAKWRRHFVVGQPHPYVLPEDRPHAEPLSQEWVDETVAALLDMEDKANGR